MKKHQKRYFNLIEITMAVAVVGIGIGGIMALFPPAIEANKSADYYNYTGNMVNTLAAYIETRLQQDWTRTSGGIPSAANTTYRYGGQSETWSDTETGLPGLCVITKGGSAVSGVYGVLSEDQSVRAIIRVWRTSPDTLYYYPGNSPSDASPQLVPTDGRIRVFIEVAWPAAAARENQTTQLFIYEFIRRDS